MKKLLVIASLVSLTFGGACAHDAPPAQGPVEVSNTGTPGQAEVTRTRTDTAVVMAVDTKNRIVTLKDEKGESFALSVPPAVRRLDEVAVGDKVVVEFRDGLVLEVQPADAANVPVTAVVVHSRAGEDQAPGAAVTAGVQATVVVSTIDMSSRVVTMQVPGGDTYQVKAGKNIKLEALKVGDRLLATYVAAAAVRLDKAPKP